MAGPANREPPPVEEPSLPNRSFLVAFVALWVAATAVGAAPALPPWDPGHAGASSNAEVPVTTRLQLPEPATAMDVFAQEPLAPLLAAPPLMAHGSSVRFSDLLAGPVSLVPRALAGIALAPSVLPTPPPIFPEPPARPTIAPTLAAVGAIGATASVAAISLGPFPRSLRLLPLLPLFSRIAKEKAVAGRRQELFDAIRAEPGVHLSDLAKRVDCGWGTVLYHLAVLERSGYVTVVKDGGFKRFFPTGEFDFQQLRAMYVLKSGPARSVYDAVRDNPGINGVTLAGKVGVRPASLARPVAQLVHLGVLRKVRAGREVRFYANEATEQPPAIASDAPAAVGA